MQKRPLGRTGMLVSEISFGAWAIGGTWGPVDDGASMAALHAAIDAGVNFIDTADVYGDGRSERLIARHQLSHEGLQLRRGTFRPGRFTNDLEELTALHLSGRCHAQFHI